MAIASSPLEDSITTGAFFIDPIPNIPTLGWLIIESQPLSQKLQS